MTKLAAFYRGHFFNENCCIMIQIYLKLSSGTIDNKYASIVLENGSVPDRQQQKAVIWISRELIYWLIYMYVPLGLYEFTVYHNDSSLLTLQTIHYQKRTVHHASCTKLTRDYTSDNILPAFVDNHYDWKRWQSNRDLHCMHKNVYLAT